MQHYGYISNNFLGGLYSYVCVVSLYDEHPFEHEFFLRISRSFPFMHKLPLVSLHAQNRKQSNKSIDDNQKLSIIRHFYLTELDIQHVHDDYIEEFLSDMKTCLQNDIFLEVNFKSLERIAHNFKKDDTRINCGEINKMYLYRKVEYDFQSVHDYFCFCKNMLIVMICYSYKIDYSYIKRKNIVLHTVMKKQCL
ncbi:unnamed protein product [Rotaria sp. Silwood1]|nr:unnamed protein product [Rotaria sp. Silwood1]CAF1418556.1 unnamed protein product [Rotaria sp. Silwood1]